MRLTFDYTMMSAGAGGLTPNDLRGISGDVDRAVQHVETLRRRRDVRFFELPAARDTARRVRRSANRIAERCDAFVVLGIGGSALGNIALHTALRHPFHNLLDRRARENRPRIFVLDNIDPDVVFALHDVLDLRKTVFNVITKSGTTAETMAQFLHFRQALIHVLGRNKYARHVIATTDPKRGALRQLVEEEEYESFEVPEGVGGRFSVLSPVGLLSAAVSGIRIQRLLDGAATMAEVTRSPSLTDNPALKAAALLYLMDRLKGRRLTVMMPYSSRLRDVADWFRQLWAESLGKRETLDKRVVHAGLTPIKALGVTDQHSQVQLYAEGPFDKVIIFVRVERFDHRVSMPAQFQHVPEVAYLGRHTLNELIEAEYRATAAALANRQRPSYTITLPRVDEESVGELLFLLEMQTAYMGALYNVNAFDQPGVEEGKQFTYGLMGRPSYAHKKQEYEDIVRKFREAEPL